MTTIGNNAFWKNQIKTLSLPPTLITIGESAFQDNSLTTVTFDDDPNKSKIQRIGINAFSGNTGLTGVTLPEHARGTGVKYKDSNNQEYYPNDDNKKTFTNFDRSLVTVFLAHTLTADDVEVENGIITKCTCNFLSNSIVIPEKIGDVTITGIGFNAFKEKSLVAVAFEKGSKVTTIGKNAFLENQIIELTLPTTLTTIGNSAFSENQIIELTLPNSLTTIGESAFSFNPITELTFPDDSQLTSIGNNAFYENNITTLTLPEGLTTIGYFAFYFNQMTTLNLSTTLTTIGENAFRGNEITTLTFPDDAQLTTIEDWAFQNSQLTTLTLPTALTTIGDHAFQNNQLTTLTFPDDSRLERIGKEAFRGNEDDGGNQLTTLALPPSLTTIGESAFRNNSLTTVTFDDDPNKSQIKNIGTDAFGENTGLTGITLPNHVGGTDVRYKDSEGNNYDPNSVDNNTFTNFTISLVAVIPPHTLTADDVDIDDKGIITKCHCGNFVSNSIEIPVQIGGKTIRGIVDKSSPDKGVFEDKNLIAVVLADGSQITDIGENAFSTNQITEITLPTTLTTIGDFAFSFNKITELTLPTALTTIGKWAFYGNKITELPFPEDSQLTSIGESAFFGNQLDSFTLPMATKEGFRTYWKDGNSVDLETNLTIPKADFVKSFELVFIEQVTLTVEVNNEEGGSIEPSDDHFAIDKADAPSTQKLTAKPNTGWRFDKWVITSGEDEDGDPITVTVDVVGVEVTVDADKTATAHFVEQVTLTLIIEETLGKVNGLNAGKNKIDKGVDFKLEAMPASGQRFVSWTIDGKTTIVTEEYTLPATTTETYISITVTFEAIPQQVTLTLAIEGEGSINPLVKPNSVDPDNEMKGMYDIKTKVTLTAKPNDGWRFDKWVITGGEDEDGDPITVTVDDVDHVDVTVDADKTATAHFVQLVTLTTSVEGQQGGTISAIPKPSLEDNQYDIKTKVTLTATPDDSWRFDKWEISDEENKTDKTTTITLDQDKTATAHFVQLVTLTTAVAEQQGGTISAIPKPSLEDNQYDIKTKVTLTATPDDSWRFDKWEISDEENKTDKTTTITLDQDKTATAHFVQLVTLTTAVAEQQGGTISAIPKPSLEDNQYDIKTKVTLTATPDDSWRFDKWEISDEENKTDKTTTITLDQDKTATAHFVQLVTLTTAVAEQQGGTISAIPKPSLEDNQYDIKTKVTLTATPDDSWRFDKWEISDEENKTDKTTTITLDQDKTATAHFVQLVTLTTAVAEQQGGTISAIPKPSLEDNQYDIKTKVTLTATPQDGWRFDKWVISDEENKTDKTTTITLDQDKTATAHFVKQVILTLIIEETLGKVNGLNAGKNKIDKGVDFKLEAMPASGQRFVSWTIDGKTIDYNPHTLTTTEADIGITVTFEAIPQQVTLTLDIEGEGSINPLVKPNSVDPDNEMKGMYDINTKVELTATPNDGWRFDKWEISDEENKTDKTTTITLDKNKSVTAHFVEGEEAITSILTEVVSATPYPNPVTSQITLKAKDGDLIQLFSQKGKQQYSAQHTGNEVHTIDVSTMPVGVYLVRITDAEGNTTTKRILKK